MLKHKSQFNPPDIRYTSTKFPTELVLSELCRDVQGALRDIYDDLTDNGVQRQNFDTEVEFLAGIKFKRTATAITYTALVSDCLIAVTNTGAARTINLPAAATAGEGKIFIIKDESGGAAANNITIDPSGGELIDGAATLVINTNYGASRIYCNGTAWFSI